MNPQFTQLERQQMDGLRNELMDCLTPDLDTDFNLYRWIHGWRGDIDEASARFRAYIENRKAAGLDEANFGENFHSHPIVRSYLPYFCIGFKLAVNPSDNTLVWFQRFESIDYHELTKVMTCGQFLLLYFAMCEWDLRQILRQESVSGRRSGLTLIVDMENFSLLTYANPNSAIFKMFVLCLCLLQDYFCDMLHRILVINAPKMVGMVLELVKRFLHPVTQQKFVVVGGKNELFKYVDPCALPPKFGGTRRLSPDDYHSGGVRWNLDPESCAIIPKSINEGDYYVPRQFGRKPSVEHIKPKQTFRIRHLIDAMNKKLSWQFTIHSDLKFGVIHVAEDGTETRLTPCWVLATPKLPEEGTIVCIVPGEYVLEFSNTNAHYFSAKLEYIVEIENAN